MKLKQFCFLMTVLLRKWMHFCSGEIFLFPALSFRITLVPLRSLQSGGSGLPAAARLPSLAFQETSPLTAGSLHPPRLLPTHTKCCFYIPEPISDGFREITAQLMGGREAVLVQFWTEPQRISCCFQKEQEASVCWEGLKLWIKIFKYISSGFISIIIVA